MKVTTRCVMTEELETIIPRMLLPAFNGGAVLSLCEPCVLKTSQAWQEKAADNSPLSTPLRFVCLYVRVRAPRCSRVSSKDSYSCVTAHCS